MAAETPPFGLPAVLSRRLADAFQYPPLADLDPVERQQLGARAAAAQRFERMTAGDRDLIRRSEVARRG